MDTDTPITDPDTDPVSPAPVAPGPAGATPGTPVSPPGAAPVAPGPAGGFWNSLLNLGLRRDTSRSWLGGVCAGVALKAGVDPLLIRALLVILTFAGGIGVLLYVLAWLLLPDASGRILLRDATTGGAAGIGLLIVALLLGMFWVGVVPSGFRSSFGGWIVPIVIGLVLWIIFGRSGTASSNRQHPGSYPPPGAIGTDPRQPAPDVTHGIAASSPSAVTPLAPALPPPPRRRPAPHGSGLLTLGAGIVAFGVGYLLDASTGFPGSPALLGLVCALATVSLIALVLGVRGRAAGLASVLAILLALVSVPTAAAQGLYNNRMAQGPIVWAPQRGDADWNGGVGNVTVDLSSPTLVTPTRHNPATDAASPSESPGQGAASPSAADPTVSDPAVSDPAVPDPAYLRVSLGAGSITLLVPRGLAVTVDASVGVGTIDPGPLSGQAGSSVGMASSAFTRSIEGQEPAYVQVQLGAGDITIKEK